VKKGEAEFEHAAQAMLGILREVAARPDTDPHAFITYGTLSKRLSEQGFAVPYHGGPMPHLLEQVSADEDAAGRGLISALVVNQDTRMPSREGKGPNFYTMARTRFKRPGDDVAIWIREVQRIRNENH
jgi:hypothetical protein